MIGELIRVWRVVNDLGARDVAKMLGVSAATVSRIERGETVDAKTMLKLICWLFQTTQPAFQGRADDK